MSEDRYYLSQRQVERIAKAIVRSELEPRGRVQHKIATPLPVRETVVGVAYGDITARAGAVPGTGYITAKNIITGTAADFTDVEAHRWAVENWGAAIADGSYVIAEKYRGSRKWAVQVPQGGNNSSSTPPAQPAVPCYSVRNNGNQTIGGSGSATITLDTKIYRYPDDSTAFTLSSSKVTIVQTGVYHFDVIVPVTCTDAASFWSIGVIEDSAGSYTEIAGDSTNHIAGTAAGTVTLTLSFDHLVAVANKTYELVISNGYSVNLTVQGGASLSGVARMNIHRLRDA